MKKNVTVRVLSLIIASVILCSAVAVAAINGSPYEVLKAAILDGMTYRNATLESEISISINGEKYEIEKTHEIIGDRRSLIWSFDKEGNEQGFSFYTDSLTIYRGYTKIDGVEWYSANVYPANTDRVQRYGSFSTFTPEERDSSSVRFVELLADIVIGDLKNNIVMSTENGTRTISGTLTETQMPEILKAGIDMLIEQSGDYYHHRDVSFDGTNHVTEVINVRKGITETTVYSLPVRPMTDEELEEWENGTFYSYDYSYDDRRYGTTYIGEKVYVNTGERETVSVNTAPAKRSDFERQGPRDEFDIPLKSLTINYVRGEAEIDANGNLLYIEVGVAATAEDILGEVKTIELNGQVRISDIDTSDPPCPIPGVEQLLTPDYAKTHFGQNNINVYFKVNSDGSIDADSITTKYPGERGNTVPVGYDLPSVLLEGDDEAVIQIENGVATVTVDLTTDDKDDEGPSSAIGIPGAIDNGDDSDDNDGDDSNANDGNDERGDNVAGEASTGVDGIDSDGSGGDNGEASNDDNGTDGEASDSDYSGNSDNGDGDDSGDSA